MRPGKLPLALFVAWVAPAQAEWHALKEVSSVHNLPNGVELDVAEARVRITALSAQVVRLRFAAHSEDSSFAVLPNVFPAPAQSGGEGVGRGRRTGSTLPWTDCRFTCGRARSFPSNR